MKERTINAVATGVDISTGQDGRVCAAVMRVHLEALVKIKFNRALKIKMGKTYKIKPADLFQLDEQVG